VATAASGGRPADLRAILPPEADRAMNFTLFRLDAVYTAPFSAPALALVGHIPDLILGLHRAFADRYPSIKTDAFRVINSNTLSEVGISIVLLDRRLEITLRVDQLAIQATLLKHPHEVAFAQDCALLMHDFINKQLSEATIGPINLRIASWLSVDGGRTEIPKLLARAAKPARGGFTKNGLDAEEVEYWPKISVNNKTAGWQFTVGVEPSVVPEADLYIVRDYLFGQASEFDTAEKKMVFLESSGRAICDWLGIEPVAEER
jgi:hypothetical protein